MYVNVCLHRGRMKEWKTTQEIYLKNKKQTTALDPLNTGQVTACISRRSNDDGTKNVPYRDPLRRVHYCCIPTKHAAWHRSSVHHCTMETPSFYNTCKVPRSTLQQQLRHLPRQLAFCPSRSLYFLVHQNNQRQAKEWGGHGSSNSSEITPIYILRLLYLLANWDAYNITHIQVYNRKEVFTSNQQSALLCVWGNADRYLYT